MLLFFFFNDTATTEIYTLSLHDALPISHGKSLEAAPAGVHPDRAAGGDRHYRSSHRALIAGGPEGPRGSQPYSVRQQSQADWLGRAQLPRHLWRLPHPGRMVVYGARLRR